MTIRAPPSRLEWNDLLIITRPAVSEGGLLGTAVSNLRRPSPTGNLRK